MTTMNTTRGGAWLIDDVDGAALFTPERLTDEHRLIARTADELVTTEVVPALERLEQKDWALARALVKRCGDLGLLGADVPESLGGVGLDKAAAIVAGEAVGRVASFATTFGAQTGLAITPLVCFGTPDQQQRYLPGLVSGEIIGAYALSESGSGSDALGAKTRATTQADGSYVLSGEKMWITNGGFADVFIVFAKVDGEHFTAFIVERGFPGVSSGKEEHKMGLHGSSTTPLLLQDARVPAANVLGEVGKGHKVALNTLNYGRFSLGAMCTGGSRTAIGDAVRYAAQRKQFGQPIADFQAVQWMIADMAKDTHAARLMTLHAGSQLDSGARATTACSMAKCFASDAAVLHTANAVQVHGGMGYIRGMEVERLYRDAKITQIYEGTNQIQRMLIAREALA